MRMPSLYIPSQSRSWSRHSRKGHQPKISKLKPRLVKSIGLRDRTEDNVKIVKDRKLEPWLTTYDGNIEIRAGVKHYWGSRVQQVGVVGLIKKLVKICLGWSKISLAPKLSMRYNSSNVLQAASRIGCKQAIPSFSWGAVVKMRRFDQRTTGMLDLDGGVTICLTRLCDSR